MKNTIIAVLALGLIVLGYLFATPPKQTLGNAITQGIVPTFATSTTDTVGTTASTIAAKSTACVSRTISTTKSGIMLSFNGSAPTGSAGHWQAASTTVSYDNANFGCGVIKAYSFTSAKLTISEFDQ